MAAPLELNDAVLREQGPKATPGGAPPTNPGQAPSAYSCGAAPGPSFFISGTASDQLNVFLLPHQTLFTHNDSVSYLSGELMVEQLPTLELPSSFNTRRTAMHSVLRCFGSVTSTFCRSSLPNRRSNFYQKRLAINNNDFERRHPVPSICLSPSLMTSSPQSIGPRNYVAPCYDSSSSVSSPLPRKIMSLNLTAQSECSLIVNIVNLMAYIVSDSNLFHGEPFYFPPSTLCLDFKTPVIAYKLEPDDSRRSDNSERIMTALERVISAMVGRRRQALRDRDRRPVSNEGIDDMISRRTTFRNIRRKRRERLLWEQRQRGCCGDAIGCLLSLLSLALFPAVFVVVVMDRVLDEMSAEKWLPISNTLCLVELQCPHYQRQKSEGDAVAAHHPSDDTVIFLESNGDIYTKRLGEGESVYLRGECIICFEPSLSAKVTDYGLSGADRADRDNLRCSGDFVKFVGPGTVWYGNGRQDLLSNAHKVHSLLFCDNLEHSDPHGLSGGTEAESAGNYSNGRFGVIESFELRQRKSKLVEKCLILSTLTLIFLSVVLCAVAQHFQPNFVDLLMEELRDYVG